MKRVILASVGTVTGLVMLLSFKTHAVTTHAAAAAVASSVKSSSTTGTSKVSAATSSGTKTVTGDAVSTQFGPVQVQITVTNGKITAADAVVFPQGSPRDQEINSYAIPQLNAEAVAAGSANIDMVSGATYTSTGYLSSLQSALDKV